MAQAGTDTEGSGGERFKLHGGRPRPLYWRNCEEPPLTRYAFEYLASTILESDAGTGDEILDGS